MYEVGVNNKLINQSLLEYRNPESNSGRLFRMGLNISSSGSETVAAAFSEVDVEEIEGSTACDVDEGNCLVVVVASGRWVMDAVLKAQQFIRMSKSPTAAALGLFIFTIFHL